MSSITTNLRNEHRNCDEIFSEAERAVIENNFEEAEKRFLEFANETLSHFKREEDILFPEFENITRSTEGPTRVMKFEHEQVRGLFSKMAEAIENKNRDDYLSLSESMMILLQQHNMKEEQMLYAMCDRVIPEEQKGEIISKMSEIKV